MSETREIRHTVCRMCDEGCGIDVHLNDGHIIEVRGNAQHPLNRGWLCGKGRAAVDLVYHPERLHSPLKRTSRGWQVVALEQALDEIASRLLEARGRCGARSVGVWKGEALGFAQQEQLARRFIYAFGSPNYLSNNSMCAVARAIGYQVTVGRVPVPDFVNARCIVLWGTNPPYSQPRASREVSAARRRGARLVVADPRLSAIARQADVHAQVRPGTDGALAWGLIHELIISGAYDTSFVERHAVGFRDICEYARAFTPQAVEEETGVPAAVVRSIAEALAEAAPQVATWTGNGVEHHENGVNNIRAIAVLGVLLGTFGRPGGDRLLDRVPLRELGSDAELPSECRGALGSSRFPVLYDLHRECHTMTHLQAILQDDPAALKALVVTGANPALTNPNSSRVVAALASLDLLVVRDLFMTETAALADYVLPAASFLERSELRPDTWRQTVGLTQSVVSFPEVQSEYDFWRQMALRIGLEGYFPWADETELNRWLLEPTGISLEELVAHPEGVACGRALAGGSDEPAFDTPSGKIELTSAYLGHLGYDEVPTYRSPAYRRSHDPLHPLVLMTGARKALHVNNRFRGVGRPGKATSRPRVDVHPDDAARLGVVDGDVVRITSRSGSLEVRANVVAADELLRGCLQLTHGWGEVNVNLLTDDDRFDPISGFPAVKEVHVRMDRVDHQESGGLVCPVDEGISTDSV